MITIDPEILKKATDAVDPGTPESNRAIVRAITDSAYMRTILSRALECLDEDALASLGATLQMGLEIGIHYQNILYSDGLNKLESRVNELEAREKAKEALVRAITANEYARFDSGDVRCPITCEPSCPER